MDNNIRKLHIWARIMTYVIGSLIAMVLLIALFSRMSSVIAFLIAGLSVVLIYFVIALTIPMNMEKPTFKERASYAVHQLGGKGIFALISGIVVAIFLGMGILVMYAVPIRDQTTSPRTTSSSATAITETTVEETTSATTGTTTAAHSSNGHNPELVAFLDAYEAFVDEYCEFMRSYLDNPFDYHLIAQYTQILETLDEYTSAANNYDTSDLSAADVEYYLEVIARCTTKMLSVYY